MVQSDKAAVMNAKITVAWWNTSLAPRGNSRNDAQLRQAALNVVLHLVLERKADFIALGEMSEVDLEYLQNNFPIPGWRWKSGICTVGRAVYEICYAYKEDVLFLAGLEEITDTSAGRTLRVAQRVNLIEAFTGRPLIILASHWPSRRNVGEHHPSRDLMGIRLRDAARTISLPDKSTPHLILLGDYNDEPFSRSLNDQLMASRDKDNVIRHAHLFYNPFWSYLGVRADNGQSPLGSYYWRHGDVTRWLTLDQIIFSSNFISGVAWRLCEKGSRLVDIPALTKLVLASNCHFDHIPVYATIEKAQLP